MTDKGPPSPSSLAELAEHKLAEDGQGGHGAMPHQAADPVVAGAAIVLGLQSIVARNVDPQETAVITVGAFQAGVANNVIPQTATLSLSVRARVDYQRGYPVLVNAPRETDVARTVAEELLGTERVTRQGKALTGSEDFAFFLEEVPGCYLLIGNGDEASGGHGACMVHNPAYDFNDDNVAVGSAYWSLLVERYLKD